MTGNTQGRSSVGNIDGNLAGLLCYIGTWITGLVFFIIEKENKFVRFHAAQSLIMFASIHVIGMVVGIVPFVGWIINRLLGVIVFVFWLIGMIKAYNGEYFKFPIVGDIAASYI